jgi:hypothetical protein
LLAGKKAHHIIDIQGRRAGRGQPPLLAAWILAT